MKPYTLNSLGVSPVGPRPYEEPYALWEAIETRDDVNSPATKRYAL